MSAPFIIVSALVSAPLEKVWQAWTLPQHVMHWNQASPDWHCPLAEIDLQVGGKFSYRMAAKDESFQFDFSGAYQEIESQKALKILLDDGRVWEVDFDQQDANSTLVTERFEPENDNPRELQEGGWQAILNSFKSYTESF